MEDNGLPRALAILEGMHVPARVLYGGRSGTPFALIASTAAVAVLFSATPFLLAPIAERYGVSEGLTNSIAVAQVGAFALANFVLPRLFRPNGRILRYAAIGLVATNILSMAPNRYEVLVGLRILAGICAGTMTWLAWASAMKRIRSMSSIAATGPVAALVVSPVLAVVAEHGDRAVYGLLAVVTIPAAVFLAPILGRRRSRGHVSRSRSNRILLVVLFALTFFGSSLYLNMMIVSRDIHDMAPLAASIGFSLNAFGGLVGAWMSTRHSKPGWFIASIGVAAAVTVFGGPFLFFVGMFWWGFAHWMGVPGVLQMLVDRSLEPAERAGDGQGVMALGRSFGPAMGGAFVDAGALGALAVVSASGLTATGLTVVAVKAGRRRLPATDTESLDQGNGWAGA